MISELLINYNKRKDVVVSDNALSIIYIYLIESFMKFVLKLIISIYFLLTNENIFLILILSVSSNLITVLNTQIERRAIYLHIKTLNSAGYLVFICIITELQYFSLLKSYG